MGADAEDPLKPHCDTEMVALVAAVLAVVLPEVLCPGTSRGLVCPARVLRGSNVHVGPALCLSGSAASPSGACKQTLWEGGNGAREGGRSLQSPCRGESTGMGA